MTRSKPMSEVTSESSDQSLSADISPRAAACARTVETTQNGPGAMPVAARLSINLGGMSGRFSRPAYLVSARIQAQRNTATGRPHGSLASRSSTSPPHLLLP